MSVDLQSYVDWAKADKRRFLEIKVEKGALKVWVWESGHGVGATCYCEGVSFITPISADEIDLVAAERDRDQREYERLKSKFEGGNE